MLHSTSLIWLSLLSFPVCWDKRCFPSPSICSQIYSSGPVGTSASEDQWETSVLHGQELFGDTDGQSERGGLDQDKVSTNMHIFSNYISRLHKIKILKMQNVIMSVLWIVFHFPVKCCLDPYPRILNSCLSIKPTHISDFLFCSTIKIIKICGFFLLFSKLFKRSSSKREDILCFKW